MQIKIGDKIRELRRRDGRKQEDLANALGVTSQAVSRWEANTCYPDMELIPSISNYFGISIDELFGYDNSREKRIDEITAQINGMNARNNGVDINIDECILMARNALTEFPGNEKIMLCLASVLYNAGYVKYGEHHLTDDEGYDVYDTERHRGYAEWAEAMAIYEKILPTMQDGPARHQALKKLSQLYLNTGEHKKADQLAETVPDLHCCREFIKFTTCDGKERAAKYGETILKLLCTTAELIGHAVAANYEKIGIYDAITLIQNAIGLFDSVCADGEYGTRQEHAALLYLYLSTHQWRAGDRDEAFASLDAALMHAKMCERFSSDAEMTFSSPLLRNVKINPDGVDYSGFAKELPDYWPWICIPDSGDVLSEMQADPRWNEWVAKTQA